MDRSDFDRKQHWEHVYRSRRVRQTSWYQDEPGLSLSMISNSGLGRGAPMIDVGGGASVLVDYLLDLGYRELSILDISRAALDRARKRLGERACLVSWIEADVTRFVPERQYELWHDRAALHFLTRGQDRLLYVQALRKSLAPGGHAIIATFAPGGPEKCSGLDVVRYDAAKLGKELGPEFVLREQEEELHVTPSKQEQLFNYFRFQRITGADSGNTHHQTDATRN